MLNFGFRFYFGYSRMMMTGSANRPKMRGAPQRGRACFCLAMFSLLLLLGVVEAVTSGSATCDECDVEETALLVHAFEGDCPEVQALLRSEYGQKMGKTGNLFSLGEPWEGMPAFYTWKDYLKGVCVYNKWAKGAHQTPYLGESDAKFNAMTVIALMANVKSETLHWTACKERLSRPDGTCPCHDIPGCRGGCSAGTTDHYNSVNAKKAQFTITECDGLTAPPDGCTDFWGQQLDPKNCWFGRGATQVTWPGNYQLVKPIVAKITGVDLCKNPDSRSSKSQHFLVLQQLGGLSF